MLCGNTIRCSQSCVLSRKNGKKRLHITFDIEKEKNLPKKTIWNQRFETLYTKICGITASKVSNELAYCNICGCNILIVHID